MAPEEARRQAVLKFGAVEAVRETYRDRRSLPFLEHLLQDTRYAARTLRKTRGFTVVAVTTIALGIGANTAIFSIIDALLLDSLPVERPRELVLLNPAGMRNGWTAGSLTWSYRSHHGLRDGQRVFSGLIAERTDSVTSRSMASPGVRSRAWSAGTTSRCSACAR